jgi:hypothetical protein
VKTIAGLIDDEWYSKENQRKGDHLEIIHLRRDKRRRSK